MELPYISRAVPESSVGSLIISLARVNADATIFRCVLLKSACDSKLTLTPIKQSLTPGEILAYASRPFGFSGTMHWARYCSMCTILSAHTPKWFV